LSVLNEKESCRNLCLFIKTFLLKNCQQPSLFALYAIHVQKVDFLFHFGTLKELWNTYDDSKDFKEMEKVRLTNNLGCLLSSLGAAQAARCWFIKSLHLKYLPEVQDNMKQTLSG
jgi:hypothetical protein